jgi:hypothetical protein
MELTARTHIPYPRDLVFRTIRDRLPELAPYMPNVKKIEMRERTDDGTVTKFLNVWTASADIPAAARSYIRPEILMWDDRARWNEADFSCEWSIHTHAWPGVVECSGRNVYVEDGGGTELRIGGTLVLHMDKSPVPRLLGNTVRPIVERIIVAGMKPNLTSIGEAVTGYLKAQPKT